MCIALLTSLLMLLTGGCQGTQPPRPSLISHVVFIQLHDSADTHAALSDCNALLADREGIDAFAGGRPMENKPDMVSGEHDVRRVIGFALPKDRNASPPDPIDLQPLEKWKPRVAHMRPFDIVDPTP
ncbi:MAG: hypothetical protein DYG94_05110 [Leptolyngbya sp. PLA3]|nr:MAG: hypothetical protein EDM82_04260 [Cyanobacteria bacterium CYA]MCE7968113.1 hypothetical protein [Leptolyngbya sp. PL-A3]